MTSAGAVAGIHEERVTAWFLAKVRDVTPPLAFHPIPGGHSNLTYRVTDRDGRAFVLRRPPLSHVLQSAHDVGREARIIGALAPTAVPVPPLLGHCEDPEVNGAPFFVMSFVEGSVLRDAATVEAELGEPERRAAGLALADVLAELHAVNPDAVGLGQLGRRDGYLERQIRRWTRQGEQSRSAPMPLLEDLSRRLTGAIPEQVGVAIVHGDYRLDNTITGPDGRIRAVLDWELCTLGDPLADVGILLAYWTQPGEPVLPGLSTPTLAAGMPSRLEIADRYASRSGRDVSGVDYYIAFAHWKLAVVLEGVATRYRAGAMGARGAAEDFDIAIAMLAERADDAARRAGR